MSDVTVRDYYVCAPPTLNDVQQVGDAFVQDWEDAWEDAWEADCDAEQGALSLHGHVCQGGDPLGPEPFFCLVKCIPQLQPCTP